MIMNIKLRPFQNEGVLDLIIKDNRQSLSLKERFMKTLLRENVTNNALGFEGALGFLKNLGFSEEGAQDICDDVVDRKFLLSSVEDETGRHPHDFLQVGFYKNQGDNQFRCEIFAGQYGVSFELRRPSKIALASIQNQQFEQDIVTLDKIAIFEAKKISYLNYNVRNENELNTVMRVIEMCSDLLCEDHAGCGSEAIFKFNDNMKEFIEDVSQTPVMRTCFEPKAIAQSREYKFNA